MSINSLGSTTADSERPGVRFSMHADIRIRQRGFSTNDIGLVIQYGEIVDEGYILTSKAIEQRKVALKRELQRLERLRNVTVIESDGTIVTVYRTDKRNVRRLRSE